MPAAAPAFRNGFLVIDGKPSPGSTGSGSAADHFLQVAGAGEILAFTEGDVLVRTEATLGGAGGEVGLHAVTVEECHAAGFACDGERPGEETARRVGAVENRCGGG